MTCDNHSNTHTYTHTHSVANLIYSRPSSHAVQTQWQWQWLWIVSVSWTQCWLLTSIHHQHSNTAWQYVWLLLKATNVQCQGCELLTDMAAKSATTQHTRTLLATTMSQCIHAAFSHITMKAAFRLVDTRIPLLITCFSWQCTAAVLRGWDTSDSCLFVSYG